MIADVHETANGWADAHPMGVGGGVPPLLATALIGCGSKQKGPPFQMAGLFKIQQSSAAAATATTAVATAAAAFILEVFRGRNAAEFDGAADVFGDFLLEGFQLALGGEEVAGNFVFKQGVAGALELADFRRTELDAGVLLVVQFLAAFVDALVWEAGGVVAQEALDVGLELEK